jgi:hypothetical protein
MRDYSVLMTAREERSFPNRGYGKDEDVVVCRFGMALCYCDTVGLALEFGWTRKSGFGARPELDSLSNRVANVALSLIVSFYYCLPTVCPRGSTADRYPLVGSGGLSIHNSRKPSSCKSCLSTADSVLSSNVIHEVLPYKGRKPRLPNSKSTHMPQPPLANITTQASCHAGRRRYKKAKYAVERKRDKCKRNRMEM